ncbi:putative exosome complex exonuclease [Gregarina niphandrodes]|uniref:Exosome complex exonuclease n=1 Tax=Gregarina niphandrodes TaxID=110365 RepID=A0A023B4E9_GRENI|nr:putative exosome complex exonuclease [Gregarina niphandrodes]EZG56704.1 putative exosome complex exonuclease [Gregarina niphandrodes]|eukprot:XP_011131172.1 putative exosome complex exonuclease [Gregarina niphandrodes]
MDGDIQAKLVYLLDSLKSLEPTQTVVTAGKEISLPEGTLLGHGIVAGTAVEEDNEIVTRYYASRTGYLVSVNSLTYVAPLHTRYVPETGDVVIGRVVEVAQGRWSVDINASHLGKLMLTSVSLPSGEQRRKTDAEVVDMRRFFAEDDIVFTEVQKVNGDQTCNLHSRNARYGKLFNGCMVAVPAPLVKRLAQHSCVLLGDVYVVLGNNGFVWIGTKPETTSTDTLNFVESKENRYLSVTPDVRRKIARVRNAILLLADLNLLISPDSITTVFHATNALAIPSSEILHQTNRLKILKQCCQICTD